MIIGQPFMLDPIREPVGLAVAIMHGIVSITISDVNWAWAARHNFWLLMK